MSVRCSSLRCCVWLEDLLRGVCSLIELQNWHTKGREKYPLPSLQTCWGLHPVSKPSRMHDARHYSPARGQSNPVSMNGADVPGAICAVCTRSDFLKKKRSQNILDVTIRVETHIFQLVSFTLREIKLCYLTHTHADSLEGILSPLHHSATTFELGVCKLWSLSNERKDILS